MPPEQTEAAAQALFAAAGVEDTAQAQRGKGVHESYVQIMAEIARKVACIEDVRGLLARSTIDFEKQNAVRRQLAAELTASGGGGARWREMLLGSAIGDAYGAGLEFYDGVDIQKLADGSTWVCQRGDEVLDFNYRGHLEKDHDGAGQNYQPGMYTDDCEMTVGFIHALMQDNGKGKLSKDDLIRWWKAEYDKGQSHYLLARVWGLVGVGRNGHGGIAAVYNAPEESWPELLGVMREKLSKMAYPGNAPPMRALPLAFLPDDLMLQYAIANSETTHPHPKATTASLCIALAARRFVLQRAPPASLISDVVDDLRALCASHKMPAAAGVLPDEETLHYLGQVNALAPPQGVDCTPPFLPCAAMETLCGPQPIWKTEEEGGVFPRRVTGLNSDAMRTVGCVLWLLKHHVAGRPLDTLLKSMYVGGDVDSLAALCLAMVGGREGLGFGLPGGLPMHMIETVESAEYLVTTADSFGAWVLAGAGFSASCG